MRVGCNINCHWDSNEDECVFGSESNEAIEKEASEVGESVLSMDDVL